MSTLQIVLIVAIGLSLVMTFIMKMPRASDRKPARKLLGSTDWLDEKSPDGASVKIQGVVRMRDHGERFVSPLTEERCVVLRVRVQVRHGQSPRAKLVEDFKIMPFVIEDADGKLLVNATHALLDISPAKLSTRHAAKKQQLLDSLEHGDANPTRSEFEETMVEVGSTVTVVGKFVKSPEGDRITGDKDQPIAIKTERARADIEAQP